MKPTSVRYAILSIATANAFILYLDRICMGAVVQSPAFQTELGLDKSSIGDVLACFFLAYALGQLPAGWLADRFGPRRMLVLYILFWSACTALTGFTTGLLSLIIVRSLCGLAEAGAYPASALLLTRWFPLTQRARANSTVAFGGRIGNSLALGLTATAIAMLGSWRGVLWIYGNIGLALALATRVIFRDQPAQHPWANQAEKDLIGTPPISAKPKSAPWVALLKHKGLWLLNLGGFGMNFGMVFLITWLPTYLVEVKKLDRVTASSYVSIALACSLSGILFGGWYCDRVTRRFGQKWGRRIPFLTGSALAAAAYLLCPALDSPVAIVAACGVVAFANDSMNPAVWSIAQDIGGPNVASTLAWGNMWGNFGASAVSKIIPAILATTFHFTDWREIFWLCAAAYILLGITILGVDTTRALDSPAHNRG